MKEYNVSHLVKSEDLNHHGTLFAGRSSEWLVEAAFVAAAAEHKRPQDILCINIHGFIFKKPVPKGTILTLKSKVVKVGRTSITVYVKAISEIEKTQHVEGFITFVCVEPDTKQRRLHDVDFQDTDDAEELALRERALLL